MFNARRIFVLVLVGFISTTAFAQRQGRVTDIVTLNAKDSGTIKPLALGDAASDLLYTTFSEPCRIFDTRANGGSPIASGETRSFYAIEAFAGDIGNQGGKAGGCNVPTGTAAIMVNFVAVQPAGQGNLKSAAYGTAIPAQGSIINYAAVPGLNIANAVAQPICGAGGGFCNAEFTVQANGAAVHLVGDVLGYFIEHRAAFVHTASAANTVSGYITIIDHPLTNGNPNAMLQVTQRWESPTSPYNPNEISVWYYPEQSKWTIFNENSQAMPAGKKFNVLVINQ